MIYSILAPGQQARLMIYSVCHWDYSQGSPVLGPGSLLLIVYTFLKQVMIKHVYTQNVLYPLTLPHSLLMLPRCLIPALLTLQEMGSCTCPVMGYSSA